MKRVVSAATLALVMFAAGCSRGKLWMRDRSIAAGQKKLAENNLKDARLNFRKALQRDPQSVDALYGLGQAELRLGNGEEAFKCLFNVVQLRPTHDEAAVQLADLALSAYHANPRSNDRALPIVENIANNFELRHTRPFDALRFKGHLALIRNQPAQAAGLFRQALALQPNHPGVTLAQVQTLFATGAAAEAESLARAFLADPKRRAFTPLYNALYINAMRTGHADQGESILNDMIAANPGSDQALAQLAAHYLQTRRPEEAEQTLGRMLADAKAFPNGRITAATFYASVGRLDRAAQLYQEALKSAPPARATPIRLQLAQLNVRMGKPQLALDAYDGILKDAPKDTAALRARAQLIVAAALAPRLASAIKDLETLVAAQPKDPMLHMLLGRAFALTGDAEKARGRFKLAREANPFLAAAGLALIEIDLRTGQFDEAARVAAEMLKDDPQSLPLQLMQVAAVQGTGDFTRAHRLLDPLLKAHPPSIETRLQSGLLAIAEKRFPDAERIFGLDYRKGGADLRPLQGLMQTFQAQGQTGRILKLLEDELAARGDAPPLRARYAATLASAGRLAEAIGQYKRLAEAHPNSAQLQLALGQAYSLNGDPQQALAALHSATRLDPGNAGSLTMLGMALESLNRLEEAEAAYRKAIALDARGAVALNNLASVISTRGGDLDEALQFALAANRLTPNSPNVADTVGSIYSMKQMLPEAEHSLARAVAANPASALYRYHLASVLLQAGLKSRARAELDAALNNKPDPALESKIRALLKKAA